MKIEPFALERWMTRWETVVQYDLAESGIQPLRVRELLAMADDPSVLDRALDTRLGYSEARGTAELRGLLAALYRETSPDEILVTTGAIEANFLLFNALLDPGDHVVAVHPAYQQLFSVPRAIGCDVSLWRLTPENDFRYDVDELERLVTDRTRMIVINTPHNPTGSTLSADELRRVYGIAERAGAWVLADEAYRWLELPGREPLAGPLRDLGARGISVGTLSKPFGLPGLRIGWMAAPEQVVNACWGLRDYVSLSPGKLNDLLATIAIRQRERILERTRAISRGNLAYLEQWIHQSEGLFDWVPPRGGLLGLLHYQLDLPSLEVADRLAAEASVMLAPGSAFGYEGRLRIGVGQDPAHFEEGLGVTAHFFERLAGEARTRR
ncbi:MAG TPA: aminotransferase class I/II-fold pyridoxal phosphate-dependent enzyme [Thermomicrobiaceae bacterium]|nr:aminotransferase class I/II-fold pyridoxal phosphate-dependent enzyme [Thermomicrobiaceae bacterium]